MQSFRVDMLGETTLRLHDPHDKLLAQRELAPGTVEAFAKAIRKGYHSNKPDLLGIGKQLFDWFDDPNEQWMAKIHKGEPNTAICFDLDGDLRDLPWELICEKGAFLGISPGRAFTPIRRVTDLHYDTREPGNRPLRVLFLASSPSGGGPVLDFEKEEAIILDATRSETIELIVEESGSLPGLEERLTQFGRDHFDVLHLTGHATISGDGVPCFAMENDTGGAAPATATNIAKIMKGHWPKVVFLSGCRTGETPDEGAWPSLCAALVKAGAPAVLGWAKPVGDFHASVAAAALYKHLAGGMRTDEAVAQVRAALAEAKSDQWHLLRLYANATDLSPLVTPPGTAKRKKLHKQTAQQQFLDSGSKSEVCPPELFVGRRRAIQRCLVELRDQASGNSHHEGILLSGMGGLGKSSLAARLCNRMSGHRRVVWVGVIDETHVLNLISEKLGDVGAAAVMNEPDLTLKQRLKLLLTEKLDEAPVLFVFDDFEQNAVRADSGEFKLDTEGRMVLESQARDGLRDFLEAIRETASDSRVIVTCRYRFAPPSNTAKLYEEVLDHFDGADLKKKLSQLEALTPHAATDAKLRERAIILASGNPRLLMRLDTVFLGKATDSEAILTALEATTETFREETLLRTLLDQQDKKCRVLLALLSVCALPVDRDAVEAIAGDHPVDPHLDRAAALGLVEAATDPASGETPYFVSGILDPLLVDKVSDDQRTEACGRAAQHLFEVWWVPAGGASAERALEIHRLAMAGREQEIAVVVGSAIANTWINSSRFREAEQFCRLTLALGDDCRILHALACAEEALGMTEKARRHYELALASYPKFGADDNVEQMRAATINRLAGLLKTTGDVSRAMELWQASLEIVDRIGDVGGKATTLHEMAVVIAQQGDIPRALKLWEESLEILERIGDVGCKAVTLYEMGRVVARQGDISRGLQLLEKSLELNERVGNVNAASATLHVMGEVIAQQGDISRAMTLWEESLQIQERTGNVNGKAAILCSMARVLAAQGDVSRALKLWQESLQIQERTGHARGKASTLHGMAWAAGKEGEAGRERELYIEAAKALGQVRDWSDLFIVLNNLGASDQRDSVQFLAQAVWLIRHIEAPLEQAIQTSAALQQKLGNDSDAAPLIATFAFFQVQTRGQAHPKNEKLQGFAMNMLGACAAARKVPEEKFKEWLESEGLNEPNRIIPALDAALEALVPEGAWLFDRKLLAPSS